MRTVLSTRESCWFHPHPRSALLLSGLFTTAGSATRAPPVIDRSDTAAPPTTVIGGAAHRPAESRMAHDDYGNKVTALSERTGIIYGTEQT